MKGTNIASINLRTASQGTEMTCYRVSIRGRLGGIFSHKYKKWHNTDFTNLEESGHISRLQKAIVMDQKVLDRVNFGLSYELNHWTIFKVFHIQNEQFLLTHFLWTPC